MGWKLYEFFDRMFQLVGFLRSRPFFQSLNKINDLLNLEHEECLRFL
jgi:hypothetical protein